LGIMNGSRLKYDVPFFQVSNAIVDACVNGELNISIYARMCYIVLCRYGNRDGTAFPSYPTIAKAAGMGLTKVKEAIKELEEVGLVVKHNQRYEGKDGKVALSSNLYEIILVDDVVKNGGRSQGDSGVGRVATEGRLSGDLGVGCDTTCIKKYIDKEITTNIKKEDGVCFDDNEKKESEKDKVVEKIVGLYNSMMPEKDFDRAVLDDLPDLVRDNVFKRWKENVGNISAFEAVFSKASKSNFLIAGTETWVGGADFDWLMVQKNFRNVIKGKYAPTVEKVCKKDNDNKNVEIERTREYLDNLEKSKSKDEGQHRQFMKEIYSKIGRAIPT